MGDSDLIIDILKENFTVTDVCRGVEIGVFRADLSAQLLRTFPNLTLYMIDPWDTYHPAHSYFKSGDGCARQLAAIQEKNYRTACDAVEFAGERARVLRQKSEEFRGFNFEPFDFVFIDGAHDYESVKQDIEVWWPMVSKGRILSGHDIDHPKDRRGQWGVRKAVEEFTAQHHLGYGVSGTCWWVVKP